MLIMNSTEKVSQLNKRSKRVLVVVLSISVVVMIVFMLCIFLPATSSNRTISALRCAVMGGVLNYEHRECYYRSSGDAEERSKMCTYFFGGRFDECDSMCRHSTGENLNCSMGCVPNCRF